MKRFLPGLIIGFIIGVVAVPIGVLCYFRYGHPPVAVADAPFPMEKQIVHVPLNARIRAEMPRTVPMTPTEADFIAGAQVYRTDCAACHGLPGERSPFAAHMYPQAPQLWFPHHNGRVVGVSDDPPGKTFWKVKNGIRLTGMPSFDRVLTETQMWQVSLLLANAHNPQSAAVKAILAPPLETVAAVNLPKAPVARTK